VTFLRFPCDQPTTASNVVRPRLLLIGDLDRPDFAAIRDDVSDGIDIATASLTAALDLCDPNDVAVLLASYADQFSHGELAQLRAKWPLLSIVMVVGAWSEGECRSGRALPGVARIAWHEWSAFWRVEQMRLAHGALPTWWLPPTASDEERILARCRLPASLGRVAVVAERRESRRALAELCRALGGNVLATSLADHCAADGVGHVIWDVIDARLLTADRVAHLRRRFGAARITVLLTFPRPEDAVLAESLGVENLVGKPNLAEILFADFARFAGG
jgi:hypothetical protein